MNKVYSETTHFLEENQKYDNPLPYEENTDILKSEIKIGNKTVPNRLVCQAMEGCDGTRTGEPDTLTKRRYERFAKGGAGIIWYEATADLTQCSLQPKQRILPLPIFISARFF